MSASPIRLLAFYLPQYHPIPENDEWWGKGFTEWTNVAKARPAFPGHYQPHIPADLGLYDLRLAETRQAQADLAREYGIDGFVYYHYWFNGKRLLEGPFDQVLASGKPDFPFCLCWANENWTRAWDGAVNSVLMEQKYSEADDREHIRWLGQAFRDPRYIRFEDKPLMLVYRASLFPDPRRTTAIWRAEAREMGLGELYLCRVENFPRDRQDPSDMGFDASVEFQPDAMNYGPQLCDNIYGDHRVYDYLIFAEKQLRKPEPPYRRFACVTPGWDNTARRPSQGTILLGSTPALYEMWLRTVLQKARRNETGENLVFINAWNEWGEGNHLEPDLVFGRKYLEATRRAWLDRPENELERSQQSASQFDLIDHYRAYFADLEKEDRRLRQAYAELERWARELEAVVKQQQARLEPYEKMSRPVLALRTAWLALKNRATRKSD